MDKDAALAIVALGVLVGGGMISKAALDEMLDPDKAASRAAEKRAKQIPMTRVDKVVQFGATAFMMGGVLMKVYDWITTGKAPKIEEML